MSDVSWDPGSWPAVDAQRPRVLVESADGAERWAIDRILRDAGYDVATCAGPEGHRAACPLVVHGRCALAARADVILNTLRLGHPDNVDVLNALSTHYPDTPVVVEVPAPEALARAELLRGFRVASCPLRRAALVARSTTRWRAPRRGRPKTEARGSQRATGGGAVARTWCPQPSGSAPRAGCARKGEGRLDAVRDMPAAHAYAARARADSDGGSALT